MIVTALWRRLDTPGHDACRLAPIAGGWELQGTAAFQHELGPAKIDYMVSCDAQWRSRSGHVHAWIAAQTWNLQIDRTDEGTWLLNGATVEMPEPCFDLDFGFTPATNLLQLRRVALDIGESADVPAAWIDIPESSLRYLPQRYERRTSTTYWYESPTAGYSALLEIAESGFARSYPSLWRMED